jgi:hypothetical protein
LGRLDHCSSRGRLLHISDQSANFVSEKRTSVDVDAVLEAVDGGDLALASLVRTADNHNLILGHVSHCHGKTREWDYVRLFGRGCCAR